MVVMYLIPVSGLFPGIVPVHLLQVSVVVSSRTFVRTVIQSVVDRSIRELVQHETCAVVSLQSNIGLAVWIIVVHPRLLSAQLVLPKLLADSEESVLEIPERGMVRF